MLGACRVNFALFMSFLYELADSADETEILKKTGGHKRAASVRHRQYVTRPVAQRLDKLERAAAHDKFAVFLDVNKRAF